MAQQPALKLGRQIEGLNSPPSIGPTFRQLTAACTEHPLRVDERGFKFAFRPAATGLCVEYLDPDTDEPCGKITPVSFDLLRKSKPVAEAQP